MGRRQAVTDDCRKPPLCSCKKPANGLLENTLAIVSGAVFCGVIFLDNMCPFYILKGFERGRQGISVKIRLDEIKEKGVTLSTEEPAEEYPALKAMQDAGECVFLSPVKTQLTVAKEFDHVRARGEIGTSVRMSCSRCLAEYDSAVHSSFTIFYTRASAVGQDEEVELAEEDLVSATYAGDEIDVAPEIAEQVIMEIPIKPLCREECRGLCGVCGADLNLAECGCDRGAAGFKFGALRDFKAEK